MTFSRDRYLRALDVCGTVKEMHGLVKAREIVIRVTGSGDTDKSTVLSALRSAKDNATVGTMHGLSRAIEIVKDM